MELCDVMVEIERYISRKGLSHDDSIGYLIDTLFADVKEEIE